MITDKPFLWTCYYCDYAWIGSDKDSICRLCNLCNDNNDHKILYCNGIHIPKSQSTFIVPDWYNLIDTKFLQYIHTYKKPPEQILVTNFIYYKIKNIFNNIKEKSSVYDDYEKLRCYYTTIFPYLNIFYLNCPISSNLNTFSKERVILEPEIKNHTIILERRYDL